MEKTRNYLMDNIKALLIFLVILGHMITRFGDSRAADILYNIIFSFHMPAFLFISGYFAKYNPKKLLANLLPLYLIFQVLQYIETFVIWKLTGIPMMAEKFDLFTPEWTLWYLVVLMIYQLVIPVIDTENRWRQIGFLLLAMFLGLAIGMTPDTDNFLAISRAFVFLPFYLAGYYTAKDGILSKLAEIRIRKTQGIDTPFPHQEVSGCLPENFDNKFSSSSPDRDSLHLPENCYTMFSSPSPDRTSLHLPGNCSSKRSISESGPTCALSAAGHKRDRSQKSKAKTFRRLLLLTKILLLAAGIILVSVFAKYDMLIDSANFKGTESYEDAGSVITRILFWLIAFLWIGLLLLWMPKRNLGFISRIGRYTLAVYLLHGPVLLALDAIRLEHLLRGNLAAIIALSLLLTWALARKKLDRFLHSIRIPTTAEHH